MHRQTQRGEALGNSLCQYLIRVRAILMFGPIRGVGESLVAAFVLTHIRFLSSVGT